MLTNIRRFCGVFFLLLCSWLSEKISAQLTATPCVSTTTSPNAYSTKKLVNMMSAANSTLMVIDADGRWVHFDSTGVPYYAEDIPLPTMTMYPRKAKVVCAMFGAAEVYVILSDGRGFTYYLGALINPVTLHPGEYTKGEGFVITPKDDICIRYIGNQLRMYQFDPATKTVVFNSISDPAVLDSRATSRVHSNREAAAFTMVINSISVFAARIVGTAPSYTVSSYSAPGTYFYTMSAARMILGNAGISSAFVSFAAVFTEAATGATRVQIYKVELANPSNTPAYSDCYDAIVYSLGWSTFDSLFFGISTEGLALGINDNVNLIYKLPDSTSSNKFFWAHPSMADLIVLKTNVFAFFTQETLVTQDLTTYATTDYILRPTYMVDGPGSSSAVLVYQNRYGRLFDKSTQTESPAVIGDSTQKLRKIVYGPLTNKFYCMYEGSFAVLNVDGSVSAQVSLQTMYLNQYPSGAVDIAKDFAIIEERSQMFIWLGGTDSTIMNTLLIVDLASLANLYGGQSTDIQSRLVAMTISVFPGTASTVAYVVLKGPDSIEVMGSDTNQGSLGMYSLSIKKLPSDDLPFAAWGPAYANLKYPFLLESYQKQLVSTDPTKLTELIVSDTVICKYTYSTTSSTFEFGFISLQEFSDRLISTSTPWDATTSEPGKFVILGSTRLTITNLNSLSSSTVVQSDEFSQGVPLYVVGTGVVVANSPNIPRVQLTSSSCYSGNPADPWISYPKTIPCANPSCPQCSTMDQSVCSQPSPVSAGSSVTAPNVCTGNQFSSGALCISDCSPQFGDQKTNKCTSACSSGLTSTNPSVCLEQVNIQADSCQTSGSSALQIRLKLTISNTGALVNSIGKTPLPNLFKKICIGGTVSGGDEYCRTTILSSEYVSPGVYQMKVLGLKEEKETLFSGAVSQSVRLEINSDLEYQANNLRSKSTKAIRFLACEATDAQNVPNEQWMQTGSGKAATGLSGISGAIQIIKGLTPLVAAFTVNLSNGGILCLVAQTYSKLVLIAMMNFELLRSNAAGIYYDMFQDVFGATNDYFVAMIYGSDVPQLNKQVVCDAGFDKMCFLNVDDNPLIANMMTFAVFFAEAVILLILIAITKLAGWETFYSTMIKRFRENLIPGLILAHNIELVFIIYLNVNVMQFPLLNMAIVKIAGYLMILANLGVTGFSFAGTPQPKSSKSKEAIEVLRRSITRKKTGLVRSGTTRMLDKQLPTKPFKQWAKEQPDRVMSAICQMLEETIQPSMLKRFVAFSFSQDLAFGLALTFGTYLGRFQILIWAAIEVMSLILCIIYRPFIHKRGQVRQIVISGHLLIVFSAILLNEFESRRYIYVLAILFTCISTMVFDSLCVSFEILLIIKSKLTKKPLVVSEQPTNKVSPAESQQIQQSGLVVPVNPQLDPVSPLSPRDMRLPSQTKTPGLTNTTTLASKVQDTSFAITGSAPESPLFIKKTVSNTVNRSSFGTKKTLMMNRYAQQISGVSEQRGLVLEPTTPGKKYPDAKLEMARKMELNDDEPGLKQSESVMESNLKFSTIMDSPVTPMKRIDSYNILLSPALARYRSDQIPVGEATPPNKGTPPQKVGTPPGKFSKIALKSKPPGDRPSEQAKISPFMTPKATSTTRNTLHQSKAVVRFKTLVIGDGETPQVKSTMNLNDQPSNGEGFGRWAKSAMKKQAQP